jgi:predicted MFS family arabinose efflux permease
MKTLPMIMTSPPSTAATRRTLSPQIAFALVAAVIGLALFASATPSPLYGIYRDLWGFSPVVLTLVYATYAFGVLASLLLAGRVSDDVGRRPVLLVALGALLATSVLFMLADSVSWLFVARGLQGLATGLALGAASAALIDLHPRRDPAGVGLTNGVASAGGIGLGILVSATLVQLLPAPRVLPYVLVFLLFAVAFAGAMVMPEPVADRSRVRLTTQRPSIPRSVRRPFFLAALAVLSSWSVAGLFLSLGPQLSAKLFDSTNHIVTGVSLFILAASGSASQLAFGRRAAWVGAAAGSVALAAGMAIIVISAATDSAVMLLVGSMIGGAGFGLAFLGALRALSAAIPPDRRAAVMSAFYVVADTGGARRNRREPAGPRIHLRDSGWGRRGACADRRGRGVANTAAARGRVAPAVRRDPGPPPQREARRQPPPARVVSAGAAAQG